MNPPSLTADYLSRFDVLSNFPSQGFAPLPTLEQTTTLAFAQALAERHPALDTRGATLKIAVPLLPPDAAANSAPRYRFISPAQLMIERFTGLSQRTLRQGVHWLTTDDNVEALSLLAVNMRDLETLVSEWTPQIILLFKQALASFWGEESESGQSPLIWLAQTLKAGLYSAALNTLRAPALSQQQISLATEVVLDSQKQQRVRPQGEVANRAYVVNIDTTRDGAPRLFRLPGVAVLERTENGQTTLLAWSLAGGIEVFDSQQAFGATLASRLPVPLAENAVWSFDEPEDEFFVALAQTLLDQQLEDTEAMVTTARAERWSALRLQNALLRLTHMFSVFSADERRGFDSVAEHLPAWLDAANAPDQLAYSALLAAEITRQSDTRGHSFLDGIDSLPDYAKQQLRTRILRDHPQATSLDVDDIEVHDLSIENWQLAWLTEDVMSLAELSLTYIGGKPPGFLSVRGRNGVALPPWMNAAYAKRLVTELDVGTAYIALLKRLLINDAPVTNTRKGLYKEQLRNQLPMLALEKKIRNQCAITENGVDIVKQLTHKDRLTADDTVVIRPLEFTPYAGGTVDTVVNMFVLGARQRTQGPFVLYSPFTREVLREFASWQALFEAISQSGELQDHVLAWIPHASRKYYADGGFERPHLESVLLEGELALLPRSPAVMSERVLLGDHFEFLFDSNTTALVQLADEQSISAPERRWILFKQTAWTLFNGLTFFISGPLAKAAWLFQLLVTIDAGLQARIEGNKEAATQSVIDLLFMISLALLQRGLKFAPEPGHDTFAKKALDEPMFSVEERKPPQDKSVTLQPRAASSIPAHNREDYSPLDFSWFGATPQMTANQSVALQTFRASVNLSRATQVEVGPFKGTYNYQGKRWVKIRDAVYRVSREQDGLLIQDDNNLLRTGPWLKTDGQGHWDFDLRLRLRGGGPKKSVQALREAKERKLQEMDTQRKTLIEQKKAIQTVMELTATLLKSGTSRRVELIDRFELEFERWHEKQMSLLNLLDELNKFSDVDTYEGERIYGLSEVAKFIFELQASMEGEYRKLGVTSMSLDFLNLKFQALDALADGNTAPYAQMITSLQAAASWEKRLVKLSETALDSMHEIGKLDLTRDTILQHITQVANEDPAWRYWDVIYLNTLLQLICKLEVVELSPLELRGMDYFNTIRLSELVMSQANILRDDRVIPADRITFFDNALHVYEVSRLQCRDILSLQSSAFRDEYVLELDAVLERLCRFAEASLSRAIKAAENIDEEAPGPSTSQQAARAASRPEPAGKPRKVFKADKHLVLVGEVRDPVPGETAEVVDVIDSLSNLKIRSYRNTGGDTWEEVEQVQRPLPRRAPHRRALARLESQARLHLEQVDSTIARVKAQAKTARIPLEIEDMLVSKAQALLETASGMQDALTREEGAETGMAEARASAFRGTIAELELKAERLKQEGRQIRIDMIKGQYPTDERVDYLMTQGEIIIARAGRRRLLSRGQRKDYLQEYEIKDKAGTTLWYAHFHYDTQDTAPQAYTAAHLKTAEQRAMSERALYAKAQNSTDVIEVYRGKISSALASKLFLGL